MPRGRRTAPSLRGVLATKQSSLFLWLLDCFATLAMTERPMIDLHYAPTPNGWKISIMLEELALPYTVVPVNIRAGDQFKPEFLKVSPNNRIPAIVDRAPAEGGEPFAVFETGAILIYL